MQAVTTTESLTPSGVPLHFLQIVYLDAESFEGKGVPQVYDAQVRRGRRAVSRNLASPLPVGTSSS